MKSKKIMVDKEDVKLLEEIIKEKTAYIINLTRDMQDLMKENKELKGSFSHEKFISKDCIDGQMINCLIKQKGTIQPSRLFCERIEYVHRKIKGRFDHHLFFWNHGILVYKVWLPNSPKDKEFKNVKKSLESVGIKCWFDEDEE